MDLEFRHLQDLGVWLHVQICRLFGNDASISFAKNTQLSSNKLHWALPTTRSRFTSLKNKTGKATNQSAIKKTVLSELQQSIQYIATLATEADAVHYLCNANKHLSEAAVLAGYTSRPETMTAHTSPELLYGLRMKPFSSVGVPEQPGFERMVRTTPPATPEETLALIKEKLAKAKRSSDWCKNLLDRFGPAVIEANIVNLSTLGVLLLVSQFLAVCWKSLPIISLLVRKLLLPLFP